MMEIQKEFTLEKAEKYAAGKNLGTEKPYVTGLLKAIVENKETIDAKINENSNGWPVERMGKSDLAIARVAVGEILFLEDVPKAVSVNEAVELAKAYGTDTSPKFINGLLKNVE